ncbi:MAG: HPr family phosphocarrier protein [Sphaerochaetaceae bacterium]|jgi:phosphocarrier protein HPr|nr:HPr family phosphocarrier protein [Sphaerochaetaceae bacterium]MDD3162648.1 HPr family phosphocarrier protein [Sphaerochaetaceae bacterium]MDD4006914.1 HPr family phosphocarrier protein [Sphaerochaetaceae bacterium]MDD4396123.1 HPr family phosphocarrier protein [Sphaerochaetaceae bacterium]
MTNAIITIKNRTGLHARPASDFIAIAMKHSCRITICRTSDHIEVNAKSIMKMLAMAFAQGEEIELKAQGDDEAEAIKELSAFLESGCGEKQ